MFEINTDKILTYSFLTLVLDGVSRSYPQRNILRYYLSRRLGGPQNQSASKT